MSRIEKVAVHDFQTGEVVTEATLDQLVELLRVAGNDTYDRLVKKVVVVGTDGVDKTTQDITTTLNTLKFKESGTLRISHDVATGTLTFYLDPSAITAADVNTHRLAAVLDHPDGSVTGAKLKLAVDSNITVNQDGSIKAGGGGGFSINTPNAWLG